MNESDLPVNEGIFNFYLPIVYNVHVSDTIIDVKPYLFNTCQKNSFLIHNECLNLFITSNFY